MMRVKRLALISSIAKNRDDNGAVLVAAIFVFFVIFGLAAIGFDLGVARFVQSQMQAAVDGAALLGLQQRHHISALSNESQRRYAVQEFLSSSFDDELFSIELNLENSFVGDQVAGCHPLEDPMIGTSVNGHCVDSGEGFAPDLCDGGTNCAREDSGYRRADFAGHPEGNRYLVRLRGDGSNGVPGIASAGQTISALFAWGSLAAREQVSRGISVRATAIARPQAVRVLGRPSDGTREFTPFAISSGRWSSLNGQPTPDGPNEGCPEIMGELIVVDEVEVSNVSVPNGTLLHVGDDLLVISGVSTAAMGGVGYLSLMARTSDSVNRIVGFGLVEWQMEMPGRQYRITQRFTCAIATENASSLIADVAGAGVAREVIDLHLGIPWQLHAAVLGA